MAFELLELSDGVLVDRVDKKQDLKVLLLKGLQEWRVLDGIKRLAREIVNGLLDLRHASDVVCKVKLATQSKTMMLTPILTLQRNLLVKGLRRVESEEFCELATVLCILMDTQLNVLAEGLVELLEVVLVLRNLLNEVEALLNDVLADDLKDLVLLESLTRDVQRKILRIDDA